MAEKHELNFKNLRAAFLGAMLAVGMGGSSGEPATRPAIEQALDEEPAASRGLTDDEKKKLRDLFGSEIDLQDIKLRLFTGAAAAHVSASVPGFKSEAEIPKAGISADYSRDNSFDFNYFIIAMTEIAQHQRGDLWVSEENDESAIYWLGDNPGPFESYNPAQQGRILGDYAQKFLFLENAKAGSDEEAKLAQLVESRFPQARTARLGLPPGGNRPLTAQETAFVSSIFGDMIDPSIIYLAGHPEQSGNSFASVGWRVKRVVDFWDRPLLPADFSREADANLFGGFLHEITHIWQNQNSHIYTNTAVDNDRTLADKYAYKIDSNSRFSNYGSEQQADMLQDYVLNFLHAHGETNRLKRTYSGAELELRTAYLKTVVEDYFPAAKQARERYEAAARHSASAEDSTPARQKRSQGVALN